jgi:Protein of unknown function (DUF2934)
MKKNSASKDTAKPVAPTSSAAPAKKASVEPVTPTSAKSAPSAKKAAAVKKAPMEKNTTKKSAVKKATIKKASVTVSADERLRMIAEAAYYIAESRGFQGGDNHADWLAAEQQIDAALAAKK